MNHYLSNELKDHYHEAIRWKQLEYEWKARSVDKGDKKLLSSHGVMYGFSDQPVFLKAHK